MPRNTPYSDQLDAGLAPGRRPDEWQQVFTIYRYFYRLKYFGTLQSGTERSDMHVSEQDLHRIVHEIDPCWTLQSIQPIRGRASALKIAWNEQSAACLILLSHSQRDRDRNPHIARDEFRLLQILVEAALPAPQPLYLCETRQPPFLITSCERGSSRFNAEDLPAFCQKLATILDAIHAIDLRQYDLSFLPRLSDFSAGRPAPLTSERHKIQAAMQRARGRISRLSPPTQAKSRR